MAIMLSDAGPIGALWGWCCKDWLLRLFCHSVVDGALDVVDGLDLFTGFNGSETDFFGLQSTAGERYDSDQSFIFVLQSITGG